MLFDNQSDIFAERIDKKPHLKNSRILKFKLDEKTKKLLDFQEILLDFYTNSMGSVYEVKENEFIIAGGTSNSVQKIKINNNKIQTLYKINMDLPTYRAYEYGEK